MATSSRSGAGTYEVQAVIDGTIAEGSVSFQLK
jgi:hypothetical protein